MAEGVGEKHQDRRDEQRDLHARLHRDVECGVHLTLEGEGDRRRVLCSVSDDRQHHKSEENFVHPPCVSRLADRLDQPFGHGTHQDAGHGQKTHSAAHAPDFPIFEFRRLRDRCQPRLMRLEGENQAQHVGNREDDGRADGDLMNQVREICVGGAPKEERRHERGGEREDQLASLRLCSQRVKLDRLLTPAAREHREATDEQQISHHRTGQ